MNVQYAIDILEGKQAEINTILRQGVKRQKMYDKKNGTKEYSSMQLEAKRLQIKKGIAILKTFNCIDE